MNYKGEEFLDKLYKDLYQEEIVLKSSSFNDGKLERIKKFLDRLKSTHERVIKRDRLDLLKKFYYDKYIIKKENITDDYFSHLESIALERGYGHLKYDEATKDKEKELIINDQKKSLDEWIDYFVSSDTFIYPVWYKYYVFNSIVKLGSFDKEKNKYNKRTDKTIANFPELNREALALAYDYINKYLNKEKPDDEKLEQLILNGSFKNIYIYIIKKLDGINKDNENNNDGIWIKYNQGSDHTKLVNSLVGRGTGWCTAGEETAKNQLEMGDFHIYYTLDKNGEYKIPRIAIRMERNRIAEIRGVAENQNLEPEMDSVLKEKLDEFPDKDKYYKKLHDMELLTKIYLKDDLSKEELLFLYEIEDEREGFGYSRDPRIDEIKKKRDKIKDLTVALDCTKEEIATTKEEALKGNIKYYDGHLFLANYETGEKLKLPEIVTGTIYLNRLTNANNIILPKIIGGSLYLDNLTYTDGLILPTSISLGLFLRKLPRAKGVKLPSKVGFINLSGLTSSEGLNLPEIIENGLNLENITSIENLTITSNIGGDIFLNYLRSAKNLIFPDYVGGGIYLSHLVLAKGVILPKCVNVYLNLRSLKRIDGIKLPEIVRGYLDLNSLTNPDGLTLPKEVDGLIYLNGLTTIEGLNIPDTIDLDKVFMKDELKEEYIKRKQGIKK